MHTINANRQYLKKNEKLSTTRVAKRGCGGGGMRIVNCEWGWQVSNIGHQTSTQLSEWVLSFAHKNVKTISMTLTDDDGDVGDDDVDDDENEDEEEPNVLDTRMRISCGMWHVAWGWLQDANAKCFLPVLLKRQVPGTWWARGTAGAGGNNIQHAFTVWAISIFSNCSQRGRRGNEAARQPSIYPSVVNESRSWSHHQHNHPLAVMIHGFDWILIDNIASI